MKKTKLSFALVIFIINASFAIPARPFKLAIHKEYKFFNGKIFEVLKTNFPFVERNTEPIKLLSNSKISLKIVIDENHKAKLSWLNAIGHQAKRYIVQVSQDKEKFYDVSEIAIEETQEKRKLYTFVDFRMNFGKQYYRIVEEDKASKTFIYAPVKINLETLPVQSKMVNCLQTEENNIIHIKTINSKLIPILTTETGMGIPCNYKYSGATQTGVLKPLYYLAGGNYYLKVRLGKTETKYLVSVSNLEGMTLE